MEQTSNLRDVNGDATVINALAQDTIVLETLDVRDLDLTRDGQDLLLESANGEVVVIENYFLAEPAPFIASESGPALTPELVDSFVKTAPEFAQAMTMTDESPVGAVHEVNGTATVTRVDGTVETIQLGTPIYVGDIVETEGDGAVNIMFIDETHFAVSEDARLAIDEYVFDPDTQEGATNFSVLRGVFMFTSGMIGREDPDDVTIDTPVGSIGIRGTVIVGDVDTGEITVLEGAIVLRSLDGMSEVTLANQFETARFDAANSEIESVGVLDGADVSSKFSSLGAVSGTLFSDFTNDNESGDGAAGEDAGEAAPATQEGTTEDSSGAPDADLQGDADTGPESSADSEAEVSVTPPAKDALNEMTSSDSQTESGTTNDDTSRGEGDSTDNGRTPSKDTSEVNAGDSDDPLTAPDAIDDSRPGNASNNAGPTGTNFTNSSVLFGGLEFSFSAPNALNFTDPEGDAIVSYQITDFDGLPSASVNSAFASSGNFTIDLPPDLLGTADLDTLYELTITATDVNGNTGTATYSFNVLAPEYLGANGPDTFTAMNNDDLVLSLAGDDTVNVNADDVIVSAGEGDDTVNINGLSAVSKVYPGDGDDTVILDNLNGHELDGQLGSDTLDFSSLAGGAFGLDIDLSDTGTVVTYAGTGTLLAEGFENVIGTANDDTITGDALDNELDGGLGSDTLNGNAGDDTFIISAGSDIINGGTGEDTVDFSNATGSVVWDFGSGGNNLDDDGFGGNATISAIEEIIGSDQDDQFTLVANAANPDIDEIDAGDGNDTFTVDGGSFFAGGTTITLDGGAGNDMIDLTNGTLDLTNISSFDINGIDTIRASNTSVLDFTIDSLFEIASGADIDLEIDLQSGATLRLDTSGLGGTTGTVNDAVAFEALLETSTNIASVTATVLGGSITEFTVDDGGIYDGAVLTINEALFTAGAISEVA